MMIYAILILFPVFLGLWAQMQVHSKYAKWSKISSKGRITGAEAAQAVMEELGIETKEFSSTAFTPKRAQNYDLLIGMTRTHAAMMRHIVPELREKVRTLIPNEDVPDPFGGSVGDYKAVFNFMKPFIDQLFIESDNPNQGDK